MVERVILIVLDSFGIGDAYDAEEFGDEGANTLGSVSKSPYFHMPNMAEMGLFHIDGTAWPPPPAPHTAAVCRLAEQSAGKDTTVGHWEICGLVSRIPLPTYPDGFPEEILIPFRKAVGRDILCNRPYSGTRVISDYGDLHVQTGNLIVYTSADSVFQIAAHESVIPVERLYEYCMIGRGLLTGRHGVGRVVARPFAGSSGSYFRTPRRHDFSLPPAGPTLLDELRETGFDVIGLGKIHDIFAGRGLTHYEYTTGNEDGMKKTLEYTRQAFKGLLFVNLVDFDMLYGHRNDVDGYARALSAFDRWLPELCTLLGERDVLIITADHGCDPGFRSSTDHTREQIPFLAWGPCVKAVNLGSRKGFGCIARTITQMFGISSRLEGQSLWPEFSSSHP